VDRLLLVRLPGRIELQLVIVIAVESSFFPGVDHLLVEFLRLKRHIAFFIKEPRPMGSRHDLETTILLCRFAHRHPGCQLPGFVWLRRGRNQLFRALKLDKAFSLVPVGPFVSGILGEPLGAPA